MLNKLLEAFNYSKEIYANRSMLLEMVKRDFHSQYIESVFGLFWAFVNPVVMILILWFVFSVGFKAQPVKDVPFVVWLTAGMAPWYFLSDTLSGNVRIIVDNSYLVKKVVFRVSLLPIVKVLSSYIIHLIFLVLLIVLLFFNGLPFSIWWFQVIYYTIALVVLMLGLSWLTSSLNVLMKDVGQVVNIVLQFGFWATPIFWHISFIPEKYHVFVKLNPMYYIIEGYRGSFIYHTPFWSDWKLAIYFWSVTFVILILGIVTFKRLRPHFADVL